MLVAVVVVVFTVADVEESARALVMVVRMKGTAVLEKRKGWRGNGQINRSGARIINRGLGSHAVAGGCATARVMHCVPFWRCPPLLACVWLPNAMATRRDPRFVRG